MERSRNTPPSTRKYTTFFDGDFAFVLKPDPDTQALCQQLATDLLGDAPRPRNPFFITLYSGTFGGLPNDLVAATLFHLATNPLDQELLLNGVRLGNEGSSLLWMVDPVPDWLRLNRNIVLSLERYLDPVAIQRTLRQHPSPNEEQRAAILRYGYQSTERDFSPHIVLGSHVRPEVLHDRATVPLRKTFVTGVHFAHLGDDGIPTKIVV